MKKFFIILTEDGEIFSGELEFATEQMAADWARVQDTDERLFVEPVLEVV